MQSNNVKVTKAVIPCGGFGTRFLPATKVIPKELMPIVDKPALGYIVEEVANAGITDLLIIIADGKEKIKDFFMPNDRLNLHLSSRNSTEEYRLVNKDYGMNITFIVQKKQDGSGNAIYLAKEFANNEPIAVLFGDDVIYIENGDGATKQLVDAYEKTGKTVVGVQRTTEEKARRCGVMKTVGKVGKITNISGIVEKPQGDLTSELVSFGRFVLTPDIFEAIERTKPFRDGEIYLTNAIDEIARNGNAVACVFEGRRYDIGNKQGYLEAVVDFALRDERLGKDFAEYIKTKQ